jgi:hypothetical protein
MKDDYLRTVRAVAMPTERGGSASVKPEKQHAGPVTQQKPLYDCFTNLLKLLQSCGVKGKTKTYMAVQDRNFTHDASASFCGGELTWPRSVAPRHKLLHMISLWCDLHSAEPYSNGHLSTTCRVNTQRRYKKTPRGLLLKFPAAAGLRHAT